MSNSVFGILFIRLEAHIVSPQPYSKYCNHPRKTIENANIYTGLALYIEIHLTFEYSQSALANAHIFNFGNGEPY